MNVDRLKRAAKKLKKEKGIKHYEALNEIARQNGFQNWKHLWDVYMKRKEK